VVSISGVERPFVIIFAPRKARYIRKRKKLNKRVAFVCDSAIIAELDSLLFWKPAFDVNAETGPAGTPE
jgi:hypothetical protein